MSITSTGLTLAANYLFGDSASKNVLYVANGTFTVSPTFDKVAGFTGVSSNYTPIVVTYNTGTVNSSGNYNFTISGTYTNGTTAINYNRFFIERIPVAQPLTASITNITTNQVTVTSSAGFSVGNSVYVKGDTAVRTISSISSNVLTLSGSPSTPSATILYSTGDTIYTQVVSPAFTIAANASILFEVSVLESSL